MKIEDDKEVRVDTNTEGISTFIGREIAEGTSNSYFISITLELGVVGGVVVWKGEG